MSAAGRAKANVARTRACCPPVLCAYARQVIGRGPNTLCRRMKPCFINTDVIVVVAKGRHCLRPFGNVFVYKPMGGYLQTSSS